MALLKICPEASLIGIMFRVETLISLDPGVEKPLRLIRKPLVKIPRLAWGVIYGWLDSQV
jgi:hypothetical protein